MLDRLKFHEFRFYFGSASLVGNDIPAKQKLGNILRGCGDAAGRTAYLKRAKETAGSHVHVNEAAQKNLLRGAGNGELAWAFYYWLHVEMPHLQALLEVDRDLLDGRTFEEAAGRPVAMDALEEPAPQTSGFPELYLGTVSPGAGNWLSPFNEHSLPFFGRLSQKHSLDDFAASADAFSIWALVGPSGVGKTRLAANWLRSSNALRGWNKGFLLKPSTEEWPRWRPERPTFIVIDDLFAHGEVIAAIVDRCLTLNRMGILRHRVRLLVIDRIFPADVDNLLTDDRWSAVFQRTTDMDARTSVLHRSSPLSLVEVDDQTEIIQSVLSSASGIHNSGDYRVVAALEQLRQMDGADRPLFAALIGRTLSTTDSAQRWTRKDLLRYYLSGADRLPWLNDEIDGDLVACFVAAATVLRGVSFERLISVLPSAVTETAARVAKIRTNAARIVGSYDQNALPKFQPDILGETFFLLLLDRLQNSPPTMALLKRMCTLLADDAPEMETAFVSFFQGLIANLIAEGADQVSVQKSWSSITKFLEPDEGDTGKNAIAKSVATMAMHNLLFRDQIEYIKGYSDIHKNIFIKYPSGSIQFEFIPVILELINWLYSVGDTSADRKSEILDFMSNFSFTGEDMPHLLGLCAGSGYISLVAGLLERGPDPNEERLGGATALLVASEFGHADVVSLLLDHGADPNHGNRTDGSTALMWACEGGHIDVVEALLEGGADPNKTRFGDGGVAIQLAAAHGQLDVVEYLVSRGADINHRKADGLTPLAMACARGDEPVVKALLRLGSDPNRGDNAGDLTPLGLACRKGHLAIAKLLVEAGAPPEGLSAGDRPLINAAIGGQLPIIEYLHSIGVHLDTRNENGVNAIFISSAQGHVECLRYLIDNSDVKLINSYAKQSGVVMTALAAALSLGETDAADLLIRSGADPNAGFEPGAATPLGFAAAFGHADLAQRLLDAGATIDAIGVDGWTPMTAACSEGHYDIVDLLIAHDAAADAHDGVGRHPLICAAANGNRDLVDMLLLHGCDPNTISKESGSTALGYACANDNVDVVRTLVDAGADQQSAVWKEIFGPFHTAAGEGSINVVRFFLSNGRSPDEICPTANMSVLTVASMEGHLPIVDELIARHASVDITSELHDSTPLMWAAQGGHSGVASRLLRAGALPNRHRKSDGKAALHIAASHGRADVVELLIRHNADPNIQCWAGITPLMTAAAAGNHEIVEFLVRNGSNPKTKNHRGVTARGFALSIWDKESNKILKKHGAGSLTIKEYIIYMTGLAVGLYYLLFRKKRLMTMNGEALINATKRGSLKTVRNLVSAFDIKDYQNAHGENALMVAVTEGHKSIVDYLIECRADLGKLDLAGNSAVTLARSRNRDAILEALLRSGAKDQFRTNWRAETSPGENSSASAA